MELWKGQSGWETTTCILLCYPIVLSYTHIQLCSSLSIYICVCVCVRVCVFPKNPLEGSALTIPMLLCYESVKFRWEMVLETEIPITRVVFGTPNTNWYAIVGESFLFRILLINSVRQPTFPCTIWSYDAYDVLELRHMPDQPLYNFRASKIIISNIKLADLRSGYFSFELKYYWTKPDI